MERALGTIVLVGGLIMVIAGFISGQSGVYVSTCLLGLFSPVTAILVFGGAVAAFCGFALIAVGPHYRNAGRDSK
jgi:hypothetical protein